MKAFNIKNISTFLLTLLVVGMGYVVTSCDDNPYKYEPTDGKPEVYYVRFADPASADSLIDAAFMESTICLVGDNLKSIRKIFFNDQEAVLNSSLITDNTLFVDVPKNIPEDVTNTMYLIAKKDTVKYPFNVLVPAPLVRRISNEYTFDGDVATIYGDYFLDDPNVPLKITMGGNIPVTEIVSIEKTQVSFVIPEGAEKGYLNVSSIYGSGRSQFHFRDDRGMILDWDNLDAAGGWRAGDIRNGDPIPGINGNYVYFEGDIPGDLGDWSEDEFSFNLWGISNGRPEGDLFNIPIEDALLKFEINVLEPWAGNALQMIFTPWDLKDDNAFISDGTPRGLWIPWETTGSYITDGWETVSFPLKDFKYDHEGNEVGVAGPGNWGGLTFFVWNGGVEGQPSSPKICIDNIRVVPAE